MKIVIKKVKNITSGFNVNTLSFDTKKGCDIYYEVGLENVSTSMLAGFKSQEELKKPAGEYFTIDIASMVPNIYKSSIRLRMLFSDVFDIDVHLKVVMKQLNKLEFRSKEGVTSEILRKAKLFDVNSNLYSSYTSYNIDFNNYSITYNGITYKTE